MSTDRTRREERGAYYRAVFGAFLGHVAEGKPFSIHTEEVEGGHTQVTLLFDTEALAPYMAHLDEMPGAGD